MFEPYENEKKLREWISEPILCGNVGERGFDGFERNVCLENYLAAVTFWSIYVYNARLQYGDRILNK